jgi:hypothetical protein
VHILARARNSKTSKALMLQTPKASFTIDDSSAIALEYFMTKAVPFMRHSKSSPLWDHMLQLIHQEGSVVRKVAAAIGQQQRALEDGSSKATDEAAAVAYGGAIRAQRQSLSNVISKDQTVHAISCLLLVVLESLRGTFTNIELHLEPCVRLLQSQGSGSEVRKLLDDVSSLIESFIISTMSFSPLTDRAVRTRQLLRTIWASRPAREDIVLVEQSLVQDMVTALDGLTLVTRSGKPLPTPEPDAAMLRSRTIQAKKEALEAVAEELIEALQDNLKEKAYYGIVLARSLLTVVFIRHLTGTPVPPEADLEIYQRIVDLIETSLAQLRHCDSNWAADSTNAFSLGLGVIAVLCNVAVQCKDFYLRRRALLVLEMCPRREGIWTVEAARFRVMSVIKAEEEKALHHPGRLSPNDIPPDCQVGHNEFVDVDGQRMLRLFWRKPGQIAFVTQDVPIGNWEPSSPLFSSPPAVLQSPSALEEDDEDEDEDEDEDTGD